MASALGQLTVRRTLRLGRATYTDLLSTGNLRLIRNGELRDRIVRLYEANERTQAIRDRNNQEFVDRMYMIYLLDGGFVAPRPTRNLPAVASYDGGFAARWRPSCRRDAGPEPPRRQSLQDDGPRCARCRDRVVGARSAGA